MGEPGGLAFRHRFHSQPRQGLFNHLLLLLLFSQFSHFSRFSPFDTRRVSPPRPGPDARGLMPIRRARAYLLRPYTYLQPFSWNVTLNRSPPVTSG